MSRLVAARKSLVSSLEDPESLKGIVWTRIRNFMINRPVQQSGAMILTNVLNIETFRFFILSELN